MKKLEKDIIDVHLKSKHIELLNIIISDSFSKLLTNDSYCKGLGDGFIGHLNDKKVPSSSSFKSFLTFCHKAKFLIVKAKREEFITLVREELECGLNARYTNITRRIVKGAEFIEFGNMLEKINDGKT